MHPLKGRTPARRRWAAPPSERLAVPMCVSGGFIKGKSKKKKEKGREIERKKYWGSGSFLAVGQRSSSRGAPAVSSA